MAGGGNGELCRSLWAQTANRAAISPLAWRGACHLHPAPGDAVTCATLDSL